MGQDRVNTRMRRRLPSTNQEPAGKMVHVDPDMCRRFNWQDGRFSFGSK